jgi:hypothetical protein
MALLRSFSSKEFLFLGLELAGFSGYTIGRNEKKMNLERFKDSLIRISWLHSMPLGDPFGV